MLPRGAMDSLDATLGGVSRSVGADGTCTAAALASEWARLRLRQRSRGQLGLLGGAKAAAAFPAAATRAPTLVEALDALDAEDPTTAQFNALAEAFVRLGEGERAADLLEDMTLLGLRPNAATFEILVRGADAPRAACELYLEAVELRVRRVVGVFEALAAHHMRGGEWHLAEATWLREYDRGGARLRRRLSQRARDSIDAGRRLAREVGAAGEAARTAGGK